MVFVVLQGRRIRDNTYRTRDPRQSSNQIQQFLDSCLTPDFSFDFNQCPPTGNLRTSQQTNHLAEERTLDSVRPAIFSVPTRSQPILLFSFLPVTWAHRNSNLYSCRLFRIVCFFLRTDFGDFDRSGRSINDNRRRNTPQTTSFRRRSLLDHITYQFPLHFSFLLCFLLVSGYTALCVWVHHFDTTHSFIYHERLNTAVISYQCLLCLSRGHVWSLNMTFVIMKVWIRAAL